MIADAIDKYFKHAPEEELFCKKNWKLYEEYVTIYSNPEIFDFLVDNKQSFQQVVGDTCVSSYLLTNYINSVWYKKENKVERMAKQYPYNEVPEAKKAIEIYFQYKSHVNLLEPFKYTY